MNWFTWHYIKILVEWHVFVRLFVFIHVAAVPTTVKLLLEAWFAIGLLLITVHW